MKININILIICFLLFGCGNEDKINKPTTLSNVDNVKITNHEDGIYKYSENQENDTECTSGKIKCINIAQFKEFCERVDGITNYAFKGYGVNFGDSIDGFISENGELISAKAEWMSKERFLENSNINGACRTNIKVKALYNGSQYDREWKVYVSEFLVEKNEVIMYSLKDAARN